MHVLIGIALKSLLIAGLTLGLLQLMNKRSAAERSWVAHIGLFALLIMAFAPLMLPSWNVEVPGLLGQASAVKAPVQTSQILPGTGRGTATRSGVVVGAHGGAPQSLRAPSTSFAGPPPRSGEELVSPAAAATALYALPAAVLLFVTLLALLRLVALRARADVLVDAHWLSALARAQRRMGFKHGTALLTSNELASPISWGLMRPVILLNSRAVEATGEAEAIIAHELAHVARMDWIKLLLARVATALFWFNPLVWVLAREAHQLREEAADDSVLAADIADTDYAQLLVGVARHECPGLLLGAHGVAPSKSSLARRVARVLDGKSVRGPVARSFTLGVFTGAVLIAAPLAALTLTPAGPKPVKTKTVAASQPQSAYYPMARDAPTDLPHIIANGVSTSVSATVAAATSAAQSSEDAEGAADTAETAREVAIARAQELRVDARQIEEAREHARAAVRPDLVSRALEAGRIGVNPEYIAAMRAAAPRLAKLDVSDFAGLRTLGVTPEFVRGWVAAGFPSITADQLMEARAVGLTGEYVRAMRAAGIQGAFEDFVQLRSVGIDPAFATRARVAGNPVRTADDLIRLRVLGPVTAPKPPRLQGRGLPAASPPNWDPDGG